MNVDDPDGSSPKDSLFPADNANIMINPLAEENLLIDFSSPAQSQPNSTTNLVPNEQK